MTLLPCINENLNTQETSLQSLAELDKISCLTETEPITGHVCCQAGFSKSWGLPASVSFPPLPVPYFALTPLFPQPKHQKNLSLIFLHSKAAQKQQKKVFMMSQPMVSSHHHLATGFLDVFLEINEKITIFHGNKVKNILDTARFLWIWFPETGFGTLNTFVMNTGTRESFWADKASSTL